MNSAELWNKFKATGKVEDYLEYTKYQNVVQNNMISAVQSEENNNDSNHSGDSFKGAKN